jgi:hypothetical protein
VRRDSLGTSRDEVGSSWSGIWSAGFQLPMLGVLGSLKLLSSSTGAKISNLKWSCDSDGGAVDVSYPQHTLGVKLADHPVYHVMTREYRSCSDFHTIPA